MIITKPCPYCNADADTESTAWENRVYFWVACQCGAHGPIRENENDSIHQWNRMRVEPVTVSVEELCAQQEVDRGREDQ